MATLKAEIRKHQQRADGTWNIKIRVTHKRQSRWLATTLYVTRDDLVGRTTKIRSRWALDAAEDLLRDMRRSVGKLSPFALESMGVDEVVAWIRRDQRSRGFRLDFFAFSRGRLAKMQAGTAAVYATALNAFARYLGRDSVDINDIRARDIREFSDWLDDEPKALGSGRGYASKRKRRCGASVRYVRNLKRLYDLARAQYNDADAEEMLIPRNPFEGFSKKAAMAQGQRSLGVVGIQRMIDAEREEMSDRERQALDLFLLSFLLMGANMADLYAARKVEDGGVWVYRRQKVVNQKGAKAEIRVRVPKVATRYLDRLRDRLTGSEWWLAIHRHYKEARYATSAVNAGLRSWRARLGEDCKELPEDFTFYAARHSWGTIAHGDAGAERAAVDEAMAHNGEMKMADIYIEKDWRRLNEINEAVFGLFRWD